MGAAALPVVKILPDTLAVKRVLPHHHLAKKVFTTNGVPLPAAQTKTPGAIIGGNGQHRHFRHAFRSRMECPALSETRRVGYWKTVTFTDSFFMLGPYHGQIRSIELNR